MANDDRTKQAPHGQPGPQGGAQIGQQGSSGQPAKAGFTKVTVSHKGGLGLPPVHHEAKEGVMQQVKHADLVLTHGENDVPSEHWAAIKDKAPIRNWIEEGLIREGGEDREERTGKTHRESLDGLKDEEAMEYVARSGDRDQLHKWATTEKRPAVREAISRRHEAIGHGQGK